MAKRSGRILGFPILAIALSYLSIACTPNGLQLNQSGEGEIDLSETPDLSVVLKDIIWSLSSYNQQPVLPESEVTAEFSRRQMSGSAGCNSYFSGYTLLDSQFSVDKINSTKKLCQEIDGLMDQETAYLSLLAQAEAVALEGDVLTITTPAGDLVFSAQLDSFMAN